MNSIDNNEFLSCLLRHQDAIYAFIKVLLPSFTDADDVFQNTCLVLWKKKDQFDPDKEFIRWARGIARNEVRAFRRTTADRSMLFSNDVIELLAASQESAPRNDGDVHGLLADCLTKLEAKQQELLGRIYSGGETGKAIAESLDTTPDALYVKVHRLRRKLLECVRQGMDGEDA